MINTNSHVIDDVTQRALTSWHLFAFVISTSEDCLAIDNNGVPDGRRVFWLFSRCNKKLKV